MTNRLTHATRTTLLDLYTELSAVQSIDITQLQAANGDTYRSFLAGRLTARDHALSRLADILKGGCV